VRETTLALWAALAGDSRFAAAAAALDDAARAALAGTTTDGEPLEVFRIGVEAGGRALAQHALLAHQAGGPTAAQFARAMRESGVFLMVATQWYWELQASTFRRGMIPVTLVTQPDGALRYSKVSVDRLRRMKEATVAEAHAMMRRAVTEERLTVEEAVRKYHHDLDVVSRQYALLPVGSPPTRCLASMTVPGRGHHTVLGTVVDAYVDTFCRVLDHLEITEEPEAHQDHEEVLDRDDLVFHVPDMNCQHCRSTIQGTLEGLGIEVVEIDLISKRVVAHLGTRRARAEAFDAVRNSGYTVVAGDRP